MLEQYDDVLSIGELQQILGIGRNTAYTLLQTGQISAFRVGRKSGESLKHLSCVTLRKMVE